MHHRAAELSHFLGNVFHLKIIDIHFWILKHQTIIFSGWWCMGNVTHTPPSG